MLKSLYIKDVALIDEVRIDFTDGFNVFTGETGAGKSILIDSICLLLGEKADKSLIKSGRPYAKVEAIFDIADLDGSKLLNVAKEFDIEIDETVSLSRVVNINGRSEYRLNGILTTMNVFRKISAELLDIFGQHDSFALLKADNHIAYLDKFIGAEIEKLKVDLLDKLNKLSEYNRGISRLGGDERQRSREIELLQFEINQIEDADLQEGEDDELETKRIEMINSEKIVTALHGAYDELAGGVDVVELVKNSISDLSPISGLYNDVGSLKDRLTSVRWELDDIVSSISQCINNINYSDQDVNNIMDRLEIIKDMKRKYGSTISDVLAYLEQSKIRLNMLINCDAELARLNEEKTQLLDDIYVLCTKMQDIRVAKAREFERLLLGELKDLNMPNAQFKASITMPNKDEFEESDLTKNGLSSVEFLFSANLGEAIKPLDRIISGGELSRFSLAFKAILNLDEPNKTIIFDEIDAGIGGNTGSVVGKKITRISQKNQVLCITHLAQIASFADGHYKINKLEDNCRTYTNIRLLNEGERTEEIGRMIGVIDSTEYAMLHSKELIDEANKFKMAL